MNHLDLYDDKREAISEKGIYIQKEVDSTKSQVESLIMEGSFTSLCQYIESSRNIRVTIDDFCRSIRLYDFQNSKSVGTICYSTFGVEGFFTREHLKKQVNRNYLHQGYGKLLFALYKKKAAEDPNFLFPKIDYTQKASVINLYKKFGFKVVGKMEDYQIVPLTEEEKGEIEEETFNYKNGKREKTFDFIVVLERQD